MNRPRGWIQDSGSLDNLIKLVELFDKSSLTYNNLIQNLIPNKIKDNALKKMLIEGLKSASISFNLLNYSC